mgnify:CR=1 FL=1
MEVRDSIEKRRSIRKFKDIPVEPAIIRQLIEARRSRTCCRESGDAAWKEKWIKFWNTEALDVRREQKE